VVLAVGGSRLSDLRFGQIEGWEKINEEVWSRRSEVWVGGWGCSSERHLYFIYGGLDEAEDGERERGGDERGGGRGGRRYGLPRLGFSAVSPFHL
jgi:hypothetical protein